MNNICSSCQCKRKQRILYVMTNLLGVQYWRTVSPGHYLWPFCKYTHIYTHDSEITVTFRWCEKLMGLGTDRWSIPSWRVNRSHAPCPSFSSKTRRSSVAEIMRDDSRAEVRTWENAVPLPLPCVLSCLKFDIIREPGTWKVSLVQRNRWKRLRDRREVSPIRCNSGKM